MDIEINSIVAINVEESHVDDMSAGHDEGDFEGAVELDEVEHVGVECNFRDLQKPFCDNWRKVPGTVAKAVELADELFK